MQGSSGKDPRDPTYKHNLKFVPNATRRKEKKGATAPKSEPDELKPINEDTPGEMSRKSAASTDGFFDDDDSESEVPFQSFFSESALQISNECEASVNPSRVLNLLEKNEDTRFFVFQLPKSLPYERKSAVAKGKGEATGKEETEEGCNLQELPSGFLGRMLVYKSGKIKMKLGEIVFDVNPGILRDPETLRDVAAINTREKHYCVLGKIENRHVVVTPDVDSLLGNVQK